MDAMIEIASLADAGYEVVFRHFGGDGERCYECCLTDPEGDVITALGGTPEEALSKASPLGQTPPQFTDAERLSAMEAWAAGVVDRLDALEGHQRDIAVMLRLAWEEGRESASA